MTQSEKRQERLAAIRKAWFKRVGVPLGIGFALLSRREIESTVRAQVTQTATDDAIVDEEIAGVESHLPFDSVAAVTPHDGDRDSILTTAERKTLKREQWERLDMLTRPA